MVHTRAGVLLAGTVNDEIVVLSPASGATGSGPFRPHDAGVKTLRVARLADGRELLATAATRGPCSTSSS